MVRLDACKFFPHLLSFAPLPWHTVWSVDVICGLGALSVRSGSGVSQSFIATSFCSFQAYCSGVLISFVVFLSLAEVGCTWSVCLLLLNLSFPYWWNASCCMCLLHLVTVLLCKLLAFDKACLCEVWLSHCKHNATVGGKCWFVYPVNSIGFFSL